MQKPTNQWGHTAIVDVVVAVADVVLVDVVDVIVFVGCVVAVVLSLI